MHCNFFPSYFAVNGGLMQISSVNLMFRILLKLMLTNACLLL
jgi:hypothetical protein